MTEFSSTFGGRITSFLDYRSARGFKKETYIRHFIKFDHWCMERYPEQVELSREFLLDWINDAAVSGYDTAQRVAAMRQFARYLCAIGEEAYILPENMPRLGAERWHISSQILNWPLFFRLLIGFRQHPKSLSLMKSRLYCSA